MVHVTESN